MRKEADLFKGENENNKIFCLKMFQIFIFHLRHFMTSQINVVINFMVLYLARSLAPTESKLYTVYVCTYIAREQQYPAGPEN